MKPFSLLLGVLEASEQSVNKVLPNAREQQASTGNTDEDRDQSVNNFLPNTGH